jgi:hypothetical protein
MPKLDFFQEATLDKARRDLAEKEKRGVSMGTDIRMELMLAEPRPHISSYARERTAVVPQPKPVAKTEEQLREEEASAILERVEKLLGVKVQAHHLVYDREEGRYGLWVRYAGQKDDSMEKLGEYIIKLCRNIKGILGGSKIFNVVTIA